MQTGRYVIMGVAGSGKSLIGAMLARALGVEFVEGDGYHPLANIERMAAGIPLTDADRHEWLLMIADRLRESKRAAAGMVVTCSALKQMYRDVLRAGAADVQFVHLSGSRALLAQRLAERHGHFMPPSLLDSQLATLEEPSADERVWVYDIAVTAEAIVASIVARAAASSSTDPA